MGSLIEELTRVEAAARAKPDRLRARISEFAGICPGLESSSRGPRILRFHARCDYLSLRERDGQAADRGGVTRSAAARRKRRRPGGPAGS
jgi:hypothetical protein